MPSATLDDFERFGFDDFMGCHQHLQQTHGDVVRLPADVNLGQEGVAVYHPDDIQKVFNSEGRNPEGLGATMTIFQKWAKETNTKDTNLFLASGKNWKRMRSVFQKHMTNPRDAHSYYSVIEDIVDQAIQYMPDNLHQMDQYLNYAATDIFNTLTLGVPLNLTSNSANPEDFQYVENITKKLFDIFQEIFTTEGEMERVMDENKTSKLWDEFVEVMDVVSKHSEKLLADAIERIENGDENTINSYVGRRLANMDEDGLDKATLVQNIAFFLLAAVDNTSNVMELVIYNLACNPDPQETLRNQIFENLGPNTHIGGKSLQKLPYWRSVLKETFRLTPNANFSMRTLPEDIELQGYNIPANTPITITSIPYLWSPLVHPDPMTFDPSRWDKSNRKKGSLINHPCMLMPFSKGKRMCVAARTAEVEISAVVCRLLQSYRVKLATDSPVLPQGRTESGRPPRPAAKFVFEKL
jgi:cytochrome P450